MFEENQMGTSGGPSDALAQVTRHFDRFAPMMIQGFFEAAPLAEAPPRFVVRSPIDMDLVRMAMRVFPIAPSLPQGRTRVAPVDAGGVTGEWIVADGATTDRRMLYLHGGGYTSGDVDGYRCFIARLSAASRSAVLAIDYRLAPEHPFPAALDDAVAAYRTMLVRGFDGHAPASRLAIVGDSAGGGLALATAYRLRESGTRLPHAIVAMSPWTDMTQGGATLSDPERIGGGGQAALYYAKADPRNPLVSPLFGDPKGLPRLLLQAGEAEGYLDDSRRFARKAAAAGVDVRFEVWRAMPHVHQVHAPVLPEAEAAIRSIGDFLLRGEA
ncbi:MAG: alpha/beta hydrolase [Alphaproteobacteria bacterium]|nr:alpha/beta hydrolase [Alphaproteobacteria bacterium]MBU1515640.1 alpha/beta hydrolase [Alphaproteobacteria bacterium]MBU2094899.1 alpha/beta hydrolase [Alphaproteobacteria bacterium]MBU2150931.1 alpha/beta hydrolase [Alphaproteobacteria bacterium]MBU2305908.1 alpha/beta hydrolase [Alphaproteobacteria bacterium]